jgi:RNA polymerase sigma-70 factor, ECF subfamily
VALTRLEEQRLISKAAAGSKPAAEALIKCHQASVFAYLLRLSGKPEVAEDVTQEAFIRVLTNLDKFDPKFRFSTWLFTIARRLYLNVIAKHSPTFVSDVAETPGGGPRTGDEESSHDGDCMLRDAVQRALMSLSLVQREIVILFHMSQWPIWLIAEHLEIPEGTVKSHLHRARKQLRTAFVSNPELARVVREVFA